MTVTPILGEPFHFQVSSRSRPGHIHYAHWLNGPSCSCETFSYKNREHLAKTGKNYVCAHLQAAKDQCWDEMIENVKEQLLAK